MRLNIAAGGDNIGVLAGDFRYACRRACFYLSNDDFPTGHRWGEHSRDRSYINTGIATCKISIPQRSLDDTFVVYRFVTTAIGNDPRPEAGHGRCKAFPRRFAVSLRAAVKSAGLRVECGLFEASRRRQIADFNVKKSFSEWIDFLYGPIFRVIGFFYRSYTANRARFERFKQTAGMATVLRALAVLVLIGWILVWYFAPDDSRDRLSEEIRKTFGSAEQSEARD